MILICKFVIKNVEFWVWVGKGLKLYIRCRRVRKLGVLDRFGSLNRIFIINVFFRIVNNLINIF